MNHPDQSHKPQPAEPIRPDAESPTRPGGYHSGGVPGEEGDMRKRMRVLKVGDRSQRVNNTRPLTGGAGAEQASADRLDAGPPATAGKAAESAAFAIVKKGMDFLSTPVFHAGESGEEEAVAVFTSRQLAQDYIDHAGWGQTEEVGELPPGDLLRWLVAAEKEGVRYATVNPDRQEHLAGDPQSVLPLDVLGQQSPSSLLRAVAELTKN